ncbi:pyocin knob domain-containing S74 family peptidase [Chromobacterium subtsugae]|uniref:pyocin knob domain-containing S74 family peptidase n=1 Tax=Chromobacterium subtsugae TaxID=251747 RepID=UPI00069C2F69|nr:pyocin knob domain-containing S74 family peptidase [Chromobacterium subtsugae]
MATEVSWYRVGQISVAPGGLVVKGAATHWRGQVNPGDILIGPDGRLYEVAEVDEGGEALTLRTPYLGDMAAGAPYAIVRNFTGSPLGQVAAELAKMQRRWLTTLAGFRDVLLSEEPQATLYDELGGAHAVMSWPAIDKAVKAGLASMEAARVMVVDNSGELIASRTAAGASAKASGDSAAASAASARAAKASEDASRQRADFAAAAQEQAGGHRQAASAAASAAAQSEKSAAASAGILSGAAAAVEEARKLVNGLDARFATPAQVDAALARVVDGAPGQLDTLRELSAALGNDKDFAANMTAQLAKKLEAGDLSRVGLGGNAQNISAGAMTDKRPNGFYHVQTETVTGGPAGVGNGMLLVNFLSDKWGVLTYRAWGGGVYEARLENGVWSSWARHWHSGNDAPLSLFRGELDGKADLNTLQQNGWWWQRANAAAASGANYPCGDAGALSVSNAGNMTFQQYQTFSTERPRLFLRSRYGEAWGKWREVWHSGNHGAGSGLDADTLDGLQGADLLTVGSDQTVTGAKTFAQPIRANAPGGSWDSWAGAARGPALQLNCPDAAQSYAVWRAGKPGGEQLAALDVRAGGDKPAAAVLHLAGAGVAVNAHAWTGNDYAAAGNIQAGGRLVSGEVNANATGGTDIGVEVRNKPGSEGDDGMAAMGFHCQGKFGVKLGLRADGVFGLGGWSASSWRWYVNAATGDMTAAGNVTWFSDRRLKTDIEPITDALGKVLRLNGYTFTRTDTGARQVGLIAQEVQAVQPEAVIAAPDEQKTLTVAYGNLAGLFVEAMKEQQRHIKRLEARIAQLEAAA